MRQGEDFFKSQFPTSEKPIGKEKDHPATKILNETIIVWALGIDVFFRNFFRNFYFTMPSALALYYGSDYIVRNALHLKLLNRMDPVIFTLGRLRWFYRFSYDVHYWTVFATLSAFGFLVLGFVSRFVRTKYEKIFATIGLMNRLNVAPALTYRKKLGKGREKLCFDSKGVGISRFEAAKDDLESAFDRAVESIEHGRSQKYVILILSKEQLPEKISFEDVVKKEPLRPYSFYIGMSARGVVQIAIVQLPHGLVAGTIGGGKSVFTKQLLLGLLLSSAHIQLYLIDLKEGLEMSDFMEAPNVRMVNTIADAVVLLRKIKAEMLRRLAFLKTIGAKEIDLKRDKMDRIVVAIDEASVLYMRRAKGEKDAELADQAREITDEIAKLSRAAAIHLILATQRVTKETIDTNIQENVSGRMAFKMNTLQGSTIVLGSSDACALPDTKGRGIWMLGNKKTVVQVPNVTDVEIKHRCGLIKTEFEKEIRKLFTPMIEIAGVTTSSGNLPLPPPASDSKSEVNQQENKLYQMSTDPDATENSLLKISRYLYENKIATAVQIRRDLFPQLQMVSVRKKLRLLAEDGHLESNTYRDLPREKAYHITSRCFREIVAPLGSNLPQELKSEVPLHDLTLVDIRKCFVSDPQIKNYYPENIATSRRSSSYCDDSTIFAGLEPDAVLDLEMVGKPYIMALEYESSRKFSERYKELFDIYYSRPGISGVFYICPSQESLARIQAIERTQKPAGQGKIYYSSQSDWTKPGTIRFTNIDGQALEIKPSISWVSSGDHMILDENLDEEEKCLE